MNPPVGTGVHTILEYGDYECPYSRRAFREIQRVEKRLGDGVRFTFRHFPLTEALQGRFREMHEILFHRQKALEDVESGIASGVQGTPTLFVDGTIHRAGYDAPTLLEALTRD